MLNFLLYVHNILICTSALHTLKCFCLHSYNYLELGQLVSSHFLQASFYFFCLYSDLSCSSLREGFKLAEILGVFPWGAIGQQPLWFRREQNKCLDWLCCYLRKKCTLILVVVLPTKMGNRGASVNKFRLPCGFWLRCYILLAGMFKWALKFLSTIRWPLSNTLLPWLLIKVVI